MLNRIIGLDPENSKDTLLNKLDEQGKQYNSMQAGITQDAGKYLDMDKMTDLGGKFKESFESMQDVNTKVQQYQRQVSQMGRAHDLMMRETSDLIKFINNPKYRGQIITIQEVSKSSNPLVTNGNPITGYVNNTSIFMPTTNPQVKKTKVIKVTFELPELAGRKTVPTKEGDPKLYVVKNASTGVPVFLYSDGGGRNIDGLLGSETANMLTPNVGKGNMDGASTNLFITNAFDTDPSSIDYAGCIDVPTVGWKQASGVSNNWSFDTCKTLADSHGSKQFALGAESWKLNVIHAGSKDVDYSGTYICGAGHSNDRIAYRNITYNGKKIPVRLLLYPDASQYFDSDGAVLGYLGGSTPWMTPQGPPFGPVKNCWPTFLHPEKLNYYITYVIEDKIWMLVEDVSCSKVAPGDTSIDEPTFLSAACIKPGLAERGTGCNVWAGKWKDGCAGGAGNVINVLRAPAAGAPGIGHVAAGAGGASASQWGSGKNAGSPLIFGEDCVTVYQLGSEPFPTSASKSVADGPKWLAGSAQWVAANGDGTGPARGSLPYYLKGALTGTAPNVSINWENNCTWTADNSDGNPFVNFEAATSKVIATKKTLNPLGKWEGGEDISVLLSVGCWYATEDGAPTTSDNDIVIAGQFDGMKTVLFDIPKNSPGMYVGVDGLLYVEDPTRGWLTVLGADSAFNDKSYTQFTESKIAGGFGGSNMVQYYNKIGKKQSQKRCRYVPGKQMDGYPVLNNINADFSSELQTYLSKDEVSRKQYDMYEHGLGPWVDSSECASGSGQSCDGVPAGSRCRTRNQGQKKADNTLEVTLDSMFPYPIGVTDAASGMTMFNGGHGSQSYWCYQDPNNPTSEKKWIVGPGTGHLAKDPNEMVKGNSWPKDWKNLSTNIHCHDNTYKPGMIMSDINTAMKGGDTAASKVCPDPKFPYHIKDPSVANVCYNDNTYAQRNEGPLGSWCQLPTGKKGGGWENEGMCRTSSSESAGSWTNADPSNPGSGGTYKTGKDIHNACSKETIPITGNYMCGADSHPISATSQTGSSIALTCPGEKPCYVHLLLSNDGELMMVSGEYKGPNPSGDILWQTKKIAMKSGVAAPNPAWKSAENVYKINGEPVPYIPGNGVLPKGSFLLSANGVFRLTYGTPLKGSPQELASDNWSADFLARFQILDNVVANKNVETTTAGGGGMAGGGETVCDSCAVIEYTVKSCSQLKYTLKFDDKTGRYVIPADKETHKYSLSGSEVALYNNPQANNTGLYSTFYVDEYNVPYFLNPDALSYDKSDDFMYFGNFSLGVLAAKPTTQVKVGGAPSDTEKASIAYVRNNDNASSPIKAFNLDTSTGEVWVFTTLDPSLELHPAEINMRPGLRLYMKKPTRVLDSLGEDCSDMVFPAGTKDIVGQAGGPWNNALLAQQTNLPDKCNLPRNLDGIQKSFYDTYEKNTQLAGNEFAKQLPGLEATRDTLAKGLSSSREEIDNTVATYGKIYKKVLGMMSSGTTGGQLEDAQLKLVEDNYQYIIWSVLAIALVMFAMSLQKK